MIDKGSIILLTCFETDWGPLGLFTCFATNWRFILFISVFVIDSGPISLFTCFVTGWGPISFFYPFWDILRTYKFIYLFWDRLRTSRRGSQSHCRSSRSVILLSSRHNTLINTWFLRQGSCKKNNHTAMWHIKAESSLTYLQFYPCWGLIEFHKCYLTCCSSSAPPSVTLPPVGYSMTSSDSVLGAPPSRTHPLLTSVGY